MFSARKSIGVFVAALLGVLVLAAPAGAAVRYTAPDGSGASPCNPTPCGLDTAVSGAVAGDEVVMAPGTYAEPGGLKIEKAISFGGQPGQAATLRTGGGALEVKSEGAVVHDLRVELSEMTMNRPLILFSGTVERVYADPAELGGEGCFMESGILRDSVCRQGVFVYSDQPPSAQAFVANVTAETVVVGAGGGATMNLDLLNTIALPRPGISESGLQIDVSTGSAVRVKARNSNYNSVATTLSTGTDFTFTPAGTNGNQTAPPELVDPGAGDFRELSTSPTIGAGLADPLAGALDLEGAPRIQGPCAGPQQPDIGAYEFAGTACPAVPGGGSGRSVSLPIPGPGLELRKVRRNPRRGTAILKVWVPQRGTLSLQGNGIASRQRRARGKGTVVLVVAATGAKRKALLRVGKTKVEPTVVYKQPDGTRTTMVQPLTLRLRQPAKRAAP